MMEVAFRTKRLRQSYEESERAVRQWGADVAQKYITRVNELHRAKDFRAAYDLRGLRLHPLKGDKKGRLSIYLTDRWRLIVTKGGTEESVIVEEVSNHYDD